MYGTLTAAACWQHVLRKVGAGVGLLSSSNCPSAFGHATRDLDTVAHGDDFIVAGCGDLDRLSQNPNENLELMKARLGPGYDSEETELNRCVIYSDAGLTWAADPRLAELAVAELGMQAAHPQTSPRGAKSNAPVDHGELELVWQKSQSQFVNKTGTLRVGQT